MGGVSVDRVGGLCRLQGGYGRRRPFGDTELVDMKKKGQRGDLLSSSWPYTIPSCLSGRSASPKFGVETVNDDSPVQGRGEKGFPHSSNVGNGFDVWVGEKDPTRVLG